MELPGFRIEKLIAQSDSTLLMSATRLSDKQRLILKTHPEEHPSLEKQAQLQHEHDILSKLSLDSVIKTLGTETHLSKRVLLLEYFEAENLTQIRNPSTQDFLTIAFEITKAIGNIHQQGIIHKKLCPKNILWDSQNQDLRIIDLSQATELKAEHHTSHDLDKDYRYLAPEQTGRMNRKSDYRSDYYALGLTLYEVLTGTSPFEAQDIAGWIHCHIAKDPTPIKNHRKDIPNNLEKVIFKLLSKNAEDRYQSCYGILEDLRLIDRQIKENLPQDGFEAGKKDISENLCINQKLYGRNKEVSQLLNTFEEVAQGESRIFLVKGSSGVGKSALIHEVQKPIVHKNGFFIQGKFDQFQKNIPYSALKQALKGLVKQLQTKSDDKLSLWKNTLLETIPQNAQLIINLVPELEQIIGKQPEIQTLTAREEKNRLIIAFRKFISTVANKEHPLVLFLDDLQWADFATMNLLEELLLFENPLLFSARCFS